MSEEQLEKMRLMLEIQGLDGNWNYSSYMFGLYNGMECMLATAEDREAVFKERPEHWLENKNTHTEERR